MNTECLSPSVGFDRWPWQRRVALPVPPALRIPSAFPICEFNAVVDYVHRGMRMQPGPA